MEVDVRQSQRIINLNERYAAADWSIEISFEIPVGLQTFTKFSQHNYQEKSDKK